MMRLSFAIFILAFLFLIPEARADSSSFNLQNFREELGQEFIKNYLSTMRTALERDNICKILPEERKRQFNENIKAIETSLSQVSDTLRIEIDKVSPPSLDDEDCSQKNIDEILAGYLLSETFWGEIGAGESKTFSEENQTNSVLQADLIFVTAQVLEKGIQFMALCMLDDQDTMDAFLNDVFLPRFEDMMVYASEVFGEESISGATTLKETTELFHGEKACLSIQFLMIEILSISYRKLQAVSKEIENLNSD